MRIISALQRDISTNALLNISHHATIGKQFWEARGNKDLLNESQFHVLRKCQNKFDWLVYEMLYIKEKQPSLNVQSDSIRAKLFV
jgi:hypothetical protein